MLYEVITTSPAEMFGGLATADQNQALGGLLYGLGNNRRALGVSAMKFEDGTATETGYYELDENLNLVAKDDAETNSFINEKFAIPENVVQFDNSSVLVVDDHRITSYNVCYTKLLRCSAAA